MPSISPSEPRALDVVLRSVRTLKKIGSPAQRAEAEQIEKKLAEMDQPEAVSFAREEEPAQPPAEKS